MLIVFRISQPYSNNYFFSTGCHQFSFIQIYNQAGAKAGSATESQSSVGPDVHPVRLGWLGVLQYSAACRDLGQHELYTSTQINICKEREREKRRAVKQRKRLDVLQYCATYKDLYTGTQTYVYREREKKKII